MHIHIWNSVGILATISKRSMRTPHCFVRTGEIQLSGFLAGTDHRWLTWSPWAREALYRLTDAVPNLPDPEIEYFKSGEYGYSLVSNAYCRLGADLSTLIESIAAVLHRIRLKTDLLLFDQLMDRRIDGRTIRSLFAFVRSALVKLTGDTMAAIYAPLGAVGGAAQGDFPLHADLYAPSFLFNIFDKVPSDGSGQSVFLPMSTMFSIVNELPCIPRTVNLRLRKLVTRPSEVDHYEEFYDLLHGEHPWKESLEDALHDRALHVPLARGQGYLLHDRHWLHGRERPRGRVQRDRLHRLIFDTKETLRRRHVTARRGE